MPLPPCPLKRNGNEASAVVREAILHCRNTDGWTHLSAVGLKLRKLCPRFRSKHFGFEKLSDLVRSLPGIQVKSRACDASHNLTYRCEWLLSEALAGNWANKRLQRAVSNRGSQPVTRRPHVRL